MKRLLTALLLTAALPAGAQTPAPAAVSAAPTELAISAQIGKDGLTATRAALERIANRSPEQALALAAVTFLNGVESAYQARWRVGATQMIAPLPVLSAELPANPDPQPLTADFLNAIAGRIATDMQAARAALPEAVPADTGLVLNLEDLWFDIDGNGQRGAAEALMALAGQALALPPPDMGFDAQGNPLPPAPPVAAVVRFDGADAHWLRAYTHLLGGTSEAVLAFDPAPELARLIALRKAVSDQWAASAQGAGQPGTGAMMDMQFGSIVDMVGTTLATLRHQPDPARVGKAVTDLRAMIAANRDFWAAVDQETDNDREWIPNGKQTAALGFTLPEGTGAAWLDVLAQAEAMLDGQKLIPYWRFAPGHGIDLSAWLADPAPVDVLGWIQGTDALPYAKTGTLMTADALRQFEAMVGGRAGLYMVLLN